MRYITVILLLVVGSVAASYLTADTITLPRPTAGVKVERRVGTTTQRNTFDDGLVSGDAWLYEWYNTNDLHVQMWNGSSWINWAKRLHYNYGNLSGGIQLDFDYGHAVSVTATGNLTITFTADNPGLYQGFITQDGTGGRTITISTTVNGTAPTFNTTANAITGFQVIYDGSAWHWHTAGGIGDLLAANNLSDLASIPTALANLNLEAGTDFLPLPTGTPTGSKFLRDDNSWQTVPGGTSGTMTTVELGGTPVGDPDIATLNLSDSDFIATESPDTEVNIGLATTVTRNAGTATLTNKTIDLGSNTVTATSAQWRASLSDEVGTGAAYFVGGALGTPASGNGSNLTDLNGSNISTGTVPNARLDADLQTFADVTAGTGVATALAVATGAVGGLSTNAGVNDQTGTTYSLVLTDNNKVVTISNASSQVVTIPANATVAFPLRTTIVIIRKGAGATTITAASGVTLNGVSAGSASISSQWGSASLLKIGTNEWVIAGAIGPVS